MLILRYSRLSGRFEIIGVVGPHEHPRGGFRPPTDVSFRNGVFSLSMDLPGIDQDNLSIEASETEVTIIGELPPYESRGSCRLMERPTGQFIRTFSFGGRIVPDRIEAVLQDGILTLKIPAHDVTRDPTRVEIRIEGAD